MKRENIIALRINEGALEKVREMVKTKDKNGVYIFFGCTNSRQYPSDFCGECQYLYKVNIKMPRFFGCYVKDYVDEVKAQLKIT
jgi:hypothetical protein